MLTGTLFNQMTTHRTRAMLTGRRSIPHLTNLTGLRTKTSMTTAIKSRPSSAISRMFKGSKFLKPRGTLEGSLVSTRTKSISRVTRFMKTSE